MNQKEKTPIELCKHFAPEFAKNLMLEKALNVTRYIKQATVNDTMANSLEILLEDKEMAIVKVLGTGCSKCKLLEQKLINLKSQHQLDFEIEKVTQLNDIMSYGVMMTPGLVIDEKVLSSGKVPKDDEILKWLREA